MSSAIVRFTVLAAALGLLAITPGVRAQAGDVEIEGTLEVLVEDTAQGEVVHHVLHAGTERFRLRGGGSALALGSMQSGTVVRVRGRRGPNNVLELSSSSSVTTVALASANTFGEQRVAVVLVNFQDNPSAPYGWADVHATTFQSASNFFLENSYSQTWLTGDVFGWFTIPMNDDVCDHNQIAALADQAAANTGVNLSGYARRVYAFPSNACAWWGLGTIGGYPSRAWINGAYALKVVAHELGHNFGDWHSKSQPCDMAGCSLLDYGDDRDMMGGPGAGHFNAYQKERLGWLNYGASPPTQVATASGTYWIDSLQTPGGASKALKILKSSSSGRVHYYIESRSRISYDAGYPGGVVIHSGHESDGNTSHQIDLDPSSSAFDAVLNPGQTFTDATIGLTVTTVSSDSAGSWVTVQMPSAPCTMDAPTVSTSPSGTITVEPLAATTLTVTVRNNDDAWCASGTFAVGAAVSGGWLWTTSTASLALSPGSAAQTQLTVTPPAGSSGSASVVVEVTRPGAGGPGGSATATFQVSAPVAPLAMNLQISGGSTYVLTATVLRGSVPVAGASVKFTVRDPKGSPKNYSAVTNALGVATVSRQLGSRARRGTYQVTAKASVGGQSVTGSGSFVY